MVSYNSSFVYCQMLPFVITFSSTSINHLSYLVLQSHQSSLRHHSVFYFWSFACDKHYKYQFFYDDFVQQTTHICCCDYDSINRSTEHLCSFLDSSSSRTGKTHFFILTKCFTYHMQPIIYNLGKLRFLFYFRGRRLKLFFTFITEMLLLLVIVSVIPKSLAYMTIKETIQVRMIWPECQMSSIFFKKQ